MKEHPELGVAWYDEMFKTTPRYTRHYRTVRLYYIFAVAIQMIRKNVRNPDSLEIACGTGHLAHYLFDDGFKKYRGFDFSEVALRIARKKNLPFEFSKGDVYDIKPFEGNYNVVLGTEILEHLKDDIAVIKNMRKGVLGIFNVPNYICKGHVRCFKSQAQVEKRFGGVLNIKDIVFVHRCFVFSGRVK